MVGGSGGRMAGMGGGTAQPQQPGGKDAVLRQKPHQPTQQVIGAKRGRADAGVEAPAAGAGGSRKAGPKGPTGSKTCDVCYHRGWAFEHNWRSIDKCQSQCAPCSKDKGNRIEVDEKGYCKMCRARLSMHARSAWESPQRVPNDVSACAMDRC
ncbi:hypothetical protein PLESTF_000903700 [Pleodorina starrii]|nr:hypothetical protein PLESTF_000903700 [Pleodorina starrii]